MATKNEENWMMHYNELKAYVAGHHHFPDKHKVEFRGLLNWAKYTRKKIKAGTLPEEQRLLFEALEVSRSDEHTGGRSKDDLTIFWFRGDGSWQLRMKRTG